MCATNDFDLRVYTFWFDREALFQVILGLQCMQIERKGGVCLSVCFMT